MVQKAVDAKHKILITAPIVIHMHNSKARWFSGQFSPVISFQIQRIIGYKILAPLTQTKQGRALVKI